jgi:hypothetical protein
VLVSYGLLADIAVVTPKARYGPGDLAAAGSEVVVELRVLGPAWTRASHVALYANGVKVREEEIITPQGAAEPAGVKWSGKWSMPKPKHDVYLVAIATGPAVSAPFWPTAKPYQPTSPEFQGYVMGVTGAIALDADGSGDFTSARGYATKIVEAAGGDANAAIDALANYDEAVAAQAARLLAARFGEGYRLRLEAALPKAAPAARRGLQAYLTERLQSEAARATTRPATRPN